MELDMLHHWAPRTEVPPVLDVSSEQKAVSPSDVTLQASMLCMCALAGPGNLSSSVFRQVPQSSKHTYYRPKQPRIALLHRRQPSKDVLFSPGFFPLQLLE